MYQVEFTDIAKHRLEKEVSYSSRKWGKSHAAKYRRGLLSTVNEIAYAPKMYALNPVFGADVRSVRYKGNYLLYRVDNKKELVLIVDFPSVYQHTH